MRELLFLSTFTEDGIKMLWIIAIVILLTICITAIISQRITDDEESFRRNFKIGFYRMVGSITALFLLYVAINTIIYIL